MTSTSEWINPRIDDLLKVKPGEWAKLVNAIAWLEEPPAFFIHRPGGAIMLRAIAMFVSAVDYAAERGAANAPHVASRIQRLKRTPRSAVPVDGLVALASEIGRQVNAGTTVLQLPGSSSANLGVQVPTAMETLIQVAINWGENPMDAGLRDLLVTYVRFAADIYVFGHWLRSGERGGIDKFLANNPWASAARLVYEISRDPGDRRTKRLQVTTLNGQFASVVSWQRYQRLHGGWA